MSRKKLEQAAAFQAQGDATKAAALYRRILKVEPANAAALHGLGMLEAAQGNYAECVLLLGRLVKLRPDEASVRNNLGNALRASGQHGAALEQYAEAVRIRPDYAMAWCNRAAVLNELGRHEEALASVERALHHAPDFADAHCNRGNILHDLGRNDEALSSHTRAIEYAPEIADAWRSRGSVLADLGRVAEALDSYDHALALQPDHAPAWTDRGKLLHYLKRYREAIESYDCAVAITPNLERAWAGLAAAFIELRRPELALQKAEQAISLDPDHYGGWWNAAIACFQLKRYDLAASYSQRALALKPDIDYAPGQCLHAKLMMCDWSGLDALRNRIESGVRNGHRTAMPFVSYAVALAPELQKACAEMHVANVLSENTGSQLCKVVRERSIPPRIRVGYLSGDFRSHPIGYQVRGLVRYHDRSQFEISGLSLRNYESDPLHRELEAKFDRFHDLSNLEDAEAVVRIREMGLDVIVDLQGHMDGQRLDLLAARIAPLQVNFLCPGTSGAKFLDYVLADNVVIPEHERPAYTEKVVTLPNSFFVTDYRDITLSTASRGEHGLPADEIVFASFCESYKIEPQIWDVWMRLLHAVPRSVLWLGLRENSRAGENLRREAVARGVDPERLVMARFIERREDHISRVALADLCLDTPTYNGQTTTADALWAGVPVIASAGSGFSSNVAASILCAAELPELVAKDLAGYEALALRLAKTPSLLAQVRAKITANRGSTPLFDTERSVRNVEAALSEMMSRTQSGLPAEDFVVAVG